MFPLPNVFLLPGTIMPLHVFEPRYKEMVEDCLDGPGRIVIATVLEEHHDGLSGAPPVHHIAGLGEIARHERLPENRFLIWLAGHSRVRIQEIASEKPYRIVDAQPLIEVPAPKPEDERLRREVIAAMWLRSPEMRGQEDRARLSEGVPLGHLVDLLLLKLTLPQSAMQDYYSRLEVADRARCALAAHAKRPLPGPEN
jgi:Lon protease-like protein